MFVKAMNVNVLIWTSNKCFEINFIRKMPVKIKHVYINAEFPEQVL